MGLTNLYNFPFKATGLRSLRDKSNKKLNYPQIAKKLETPNQLKKLFILVKENPWHILPLPSIASCKKTFISNVHERRGSKYNELWKGIPMEDL